MNEEGKVEIRIIEAGKWDEKTLQDILRLEQECFPIEWQYEDGEEYYREMLGDPKNIHIFLTKNNKSIGYVFGKPHNEMLEELQADDVDLKSKTDFFYLESIQILPEARGTGGARKLLETFCEEAKKKSFVKFSIHARTSNGFSQMVKKVFAGKMLKERRIERWKYGGDEPYEYLEWGI